VRTWPERLFRRYPVATIALSGLTPLPFFPFKALAFATGCPAGKYILAVAMRCVPRYALLAWLGAAVRVPLWIMVVLFALLMIPSLRLVWWPRAAS
jgi:ribonucleoside-triphosphate reductase